GALLDHGPGRHQTVLADYRAVEDHRLDADQTTVTDGATMQHRLVAHGHAPAHLEWKAGVGVQHGPILDVALLADLQVVGIAAQHRLIPDAGAAFEGYLTDHVGGLRYINVRMDLGA